jgi:formylglycine-generating enzyme required for sulfatase activity
MEFVLIPPGKFVMGAPPTEVYWLYGTEQPLHEVTIERPFYLGKYPVTQQEWKSVMWNNPSCFVGDERLPVEGVSWDDCRDFITELNCRKDGWSYRFPSEAQWEYACRAGTTTAFAYGDNLTADQANCDGISDGGDFSRRKLWHRTTPAGKFPPNAWGLHDMHGNVWEWCQDRWHRDYTGAPADGSVWESGFSTERVLRGGSWCATIAQCRSGARESCEPHIAAWWGTGVRVVAYPR